MMQEILQTPVRFGLVLLLVLAILGVPAMADQGNSSLPDTSVTDANFTAIETTTMPPVMETATVTEAATEVPATMDTRIPALAPTAEVTDARERNPVSSTSGIMPDTLQISEEPARAPVANFDASMTSGVVPMFVRFTDTTTNTPISWLWDFGDSGTSTVRNATHTYRMTGTYSVNLTVTNSAGSDSEVKSGYITVSPGSEGGLANTAWPKFGYDSRNTGQSPYTGPQSNSTLWVKTGTLVYSYSTPVLGSDNSIYLASISSIRKLDSDGNLLWVNSTLQTINTPALGLDGTIYAGTLSGGVYAINPDGSIQWNYPTGGINSYGGSPAIGSDGTIYIGSTDKNLYALNPNGTLKWQNSTPAPISSGPAIGSDGTVYVVSGTDPYAFNPDGTVKWISSAFMSVGSGGRGYSSPVIGPDGTIYITVYQGTNLSALNPDGSLKWSYTLGGSYGYGSPAVASDGTIYLAHYGDGNIYALNPDGTRKWSYATGKTGLKVYSSPVIGADGIVYVGFSDNKIYALNQDGTLKWTYTTGGQIRNSPAIGRDGTLYVGSCDGYLYAFAGSVSFTADPTSGPKPLTVRFTDMSTNSPTGWAWTFGDGSTSAEQNPVHTYTTAGTYTVNLTVTHPKGTSSLARSGFIRVTSVPVAGFTANETTGTVPFTVRFTDTSTNSPENWAWEFGDGSTSTEQNPVHTYTAAGTYTVNLSASNADGSTTNVKANYIGVFIPPVANFTTNATSGVIPLVVQFVDTSANAPTAWFWDFGDGTNSTEQNPVHRYPTAGTYSVNLTVSNFAGSDAEEKTGFITAQETVPVARFSGAPTSGTAPLTVTFTDASGGVITGYRWSFGDGTTSTLASPTHQYTTAGTYIVNLTVTGPGGSDSEEKPGYIRVYSEPIANFTSDVTSGSAPLTVRFVDTSAGNPTSWLWDFGDGSTSTDQNPSHTYTTTTTDTITFTVSLTATNYLGNNTLAKPDTITLSSSPPGISFTGSPRVSTAVPLTVRFNDTSTLSPVSWYWEFGDGGNSTEQNPVHTYTATGSYTVNLTATNIIGTSTSSKTQFINVLTQQPIAAQNCVNLYVANDEGVKYDIPNGVRAEGSYIYVPNTYYFASRGGLNALSISDGTYFSTITRTTNQSGTFWLDFGGGQPTMHDGILMLAVNGTIPDDFYVHIRTSGDNWTLLSGPAVGNNDAPTEYHYIEGAVDQTFTKEDFTYGPQIWRPCSKADYPIYNGQNMSDTDNTFQIMFIDTRVGACGDRIKIEYSFYNLTTFASFDCYGWYIASNHGTGIIMTNSASSGYMVTGIPGAPVANFTSRTESNDYLSPVWFTDTSANVPQAWYWDFGDGNTSTEQNPTHTYSTPGTYTVNLTVTNYRGTDTVTKTGYITKIISPAPVADFTANVISGVSPLLVQFTDQSTGTVINWFWDFGDGTNSTSQNPTHWYAPGMYSVNLTVANSDSSKSLLKTGYITVASNGRTNQFVNPGFETGDLTGWTVVVPANVIINSDYTHNGNFSLFFNEQTTIEQYIDLTNVTNISF
ncbi:MAG: PKD domain-containing protein, partial [Methanoregula sp.]